MQTDSSTNIILNYMLSAKRLMHNSLFRVRTYVTLSAPRVKGEYFQGNIFDYHPADLDPRSRLFLSF